MESTAFFEKKLSLTPTDLNELKKTPIDDILLRKAKEAMESKCSEHGFVLPGSVKLLSRSMGYFEAARFTGDTVYYVKAEGKIIYPANGVRVIGEVIRKNKMGLIVDYNKAIRIQVPRDLHLGSEEFEALQIGDVIEIEIKCSTFAINDPYILSTGVFVEKKEAITEGIVVPRSEGVPESKEDYPPSGGVPESKEDITEAVEKAVDEDEDAEDEDAASIGEEESEEEEELADSGEESAEE
jgi:hypothetical protein